MKLRGLSGRLMSDAAQRFGSAFGAMTAAAQVHSRPAPQRLTRLTLASWSQQDTIAKKGTPAADDELPKAASLARLLSYASRTSSGMTAFPSGDIDAAEKGGTVFARIKRHVRTPKRASLQVHPNPKTYPYHNPNLYLTKLKP